jgi:uncharacterized protein (DUF302 family)
MIYTRNTTDDVATAAERVKQATVENQFGVIGSLNLQTKMAEKGVELENECIILDVCNPQRAKQALMVAMEASTFLPCRISVYAKDGKTHISTLLPTELMKQFGSGELLPIAEEVEATLMRIIDQSRAE